MRYFEPNCTFSRKGLFLQQSSIVTATKTHHETAIHCSTACFVKV
jgi:hypothetical protein